MKRYLSLTVFLLLLFLIHLNAQTISIETKNCQLALNVGKNQKLYQAYLGKKFTVGKELPAGKHEAYIPAGTDNLFEPAIRIIHADGNPSLELLYVNQET